jgi:hypothetical protein
LADARFDGVQPGAGAGFAVAGGGDVDADGVPDLFIGAPYHHNSKAGEEVGAAYLVLGPAAGSSSLADADATLFGETTRWGGQAGRALAGAGDTDGDGHDDLLVGDLNWSAPISEAPRGNDSGAAYLVRGPVSGEMDLGAADARIYGEVSQFVGKSVAGAGDVNADGLTDVLALAGDDSVCGAWYGPLSGELDFGDSDAAFGDYCTLVAGRGDTDGDGTDDVFLGGGDGTATAFLFLGPPTAGTSSVLSADVSFVGVSLGNWDGPGLSIAGDVDADGRDDLLLGAQYDDKSDYDAGAAYLVLGGATGTVSLADAQAKFTGIAYNDQAGRAVAGAGDTDADGLEDILVGSSHASAKPLGAGEVSLFLAGGQ